MINLLLIAFGGAIGAVLRFLMSEMVIRIAGSAFPWATILVNLVGCFLIGLLWGVLSVIDVSNNLRLFIFTGLLGAFTTFSTFALENFHLLRNGDYSLMAMNVAISNILGVFLVFAGFYISKILAYKY